MDDLITFFVNFEKRVMPRCATWGRGLLCFCTTACFDCVNIGELSYMFC